MRILKKHVLLRLVNSYLVDSPQPANLSYLWNFGSLLGFCLIIQILTGCFLAMHYTPNVDFAFSSVEHLMRDVNNGWILRYTHANVASFFFIFVYAQFYNFYFYLLFSSFKIYVYFFIKRVLNQTAKILISLLYFNKLIMENFLNIFRPSLSNSMNAYKYKKKNKRLKVKWNCDDDFLQWYSGFTDAEGSFKINTKNNKEVHFVFQITLHIEDVAVLYIIREKLGIGIVSITGKTCSFRIHSFQLIVENLLPIFDKCPLLTHKQLNYRDWKKAILLKK
jgi:hypothetical protein